MIALAGKAATEIVFGDVDMGSINDVQKARRLVETLVSDHGIYGFDKIEMYYHESNDFLRTVEDCICSELDRHYQSVRKILIQNRAFLDAVANKLIEKKTVLNTDIAEIKKSLNLIS